MVFYVRFETGVREVIPTQIDESHGIGYKDDKVILNPYTIGGNHILNLDTGILELGDVQIPERSVVTAFALDHFFDEKGFVTQHLPNPGELSYYPTLFELERIASEIQLGEVVYVRSDYNSPFLKEDWTYKRQAEAFRSFKQDYQKAKEQSKLGKPCVEGYFRELKDDKGYSDDQMANIFGVDLLDQLRKRIL